MVPASYHDFFGASATVAGALIGLLFVAISVAPERMTGDKASAEHQVRAGAAFSSLVNALVIALIALLPGTGLGETAIALAAVGLSSTAGLIIVLYRGRQRSRIRLSQVTLLAGLIIPYALQLADGIALQESPRHVSRVNSLAVLSVIFFAFAIARAWELVGAQDSKLLHTVAVLARERARGTDQADQADHPPRTGLASDPAAASGHGDPDPAPRHGDPGQ